MPIGRYRQLRVYERSVLLRRRILTLSRSWPADERRSLSDQIRRSSRAVGACIAEAWAKRRYERHFVSKLTDALAEVEETAVWLDIAQEGGYLCDVDHDELVAVCDALAGGLVLMMRQPAKWCGPRHLVREHDAVYRV